MQLHRARDDFGPDRGRLILIGQATPRHAAHFRRRFEIDLPMLADEQRLSYHAAGAKMASFNELLGPRVVAKGMLSTARYGVVQGRTIGHPAQLGGAMVIVPSGSVVWSHMSQDASDNASPQEIVAALGAVR